jgi:hypothetical protein
MNLTYWISVILGFLFSVWWGDAIISKFIQKSWKKTLIIDTTEKYKWLSSVVGKVERPIYLTNGASDRFKG